MTIAPTELLAGLIAPYQNVALESSLNEPTLSVNVNEGDWVHRGEVLAVLNTDDLEATLRADVATAHSNASKVSQNTYQAGETITQSSQSVQSAQAAVRQAEQNLSNDSGNLARDQALFQNGYIAETTLVQQRTLVANDQQTIRSDRANLTAMQAAQSANGTMKTGLQASIVQGSQADVAMAYAQADQIRAEIARGTIVSPVDGIVVNRNLNPGEYPGTRQIFTVQQVDPMYAVFSASGTQLVGIRNGAKLNFNSIDAPGRHYVATVIGVLDQVQPGSTNFVVKAILSNPDHSLKSGMAISGQVALQTEHGIGVPVTAFLDDSHTSVMVVDPDGVVHSHPVQQIGAPGDSNAIVGGLAPGTTIITNGQLGLVDGQKVALR